MICNLSRKVRFSFSCSPFYIIFPNAAYVGRLPSGRFAVSALWLTPPSCPLSSFFLEFSGSNL